MEYMILTLCAACFYGCLQILRLSKKKNYAKPFVREVNQIMLEANTQSLLKIVVPSYNGKYKQEFVGTFWLASLEVHPQRRVQYEFPLEPLRPFSQMIKPPVIEAKFVGIHSIE